jgi:hypothetical protein
MMIYHHRRAPALSGSQGRFINHHEADSSRQDVPEMRRRLVAGRSDFGVGLLGGYDVSCDVTEYQHYSFLGHGSCSSGLEKSGRCLLNHFSVQECCGRGRFTVAVPA